MLLLAASAALASYVFTPMREALVRADGVLEVKVERWSCESPPGRPIIKRTLIQTTVTRSYKGSAVGDRVSVVIPGCAEGDLEHEDYRYDFAAGDVWFFIGTNNSLGELRPDFGRWWIQRKSESGRSYAENYFSRSSAVMTDCTERVLSPAVPPEQLFDLVRVPTGREETRVRSSEETRPKCAYQWDNLLEQISSYLEPK
jgi:hypothetical protein